MPGGGLHRDPGGGRPGGARRDLGRAQVRVRRGGPDLPGLPGPGRGGAADRAGRGPGQDRRAGGRVRDPGGQRVPRRRREPAPAGAVQRRHARGGGARGGGVRGHPRPVHRARRLDHRRARRGHGQVQVHDQDVHPGGPGHHAAAPLRVRPGGAVQPGEDLPDPAAVRRGPRAAPRRAPRGRRGPCGAILTSTAEQFLTSTAGAILTSTCGAILTGTPEQC